MIITAAYLAAVAFGTGVPFGSGIMLGTVIADTLIGIEMFA